MVRIIIKVQKSHGLTQENQSGWEKLPLSNLKNTAIVPYGYTHRYKKSGLEAATMLGRKAVDSDQGGSLKTREAEEIQRLINVAMTTTW